MSLSSFSVSASIQPGMVTQGVKKGGHRPVFPVGLLFLVVGFDKKLFTNKPKLLILFCCDKKFCPKFLVTLNKNRYGPSVCKF